MRSDRFLMTTQFILHLIKDAANCLLITLKMQLFSNPKTLKIQLKFTKKETKKKKNQKTAIMIFHGGVSSLTRIAHRISFNDPIQSTIVQNLRHVE